MIYVLYNPKARNGKTCVDAVLGDRVKDKFEQIDLIGLDVPKFIAGLTTSDMVCLCGGDGTINHFANDAYGMDIPCPVYLAKGGTGNDFFKDLDISEETVDLRPYIKKLPLVEVNGIKRRFINGIGFGVDGQVCEEADDLMEKKPGTVVNYTSLAIQILMFRYKTPHARVTVDGVEHEFDKTWIAATMKGRYYGGGMMVAPEQSRDGDDVSLMIMHGGSRIKILTIFPGIFKGEHINHHKYVDMFHAKEVKVEFDRPTALQIDGETVRGVTSYKVICD